MMKASNKKNLFKSYCGFYAFFWFIEMKGLEMVKCKSLRINMLRITHTGKSVYVLVTPLERKLVTKWERSSAQTSLNSLGESRINEQNQEEGKIAWARCHSCQKKTLWRYIQRYQNDEPFYGVCPYSYSNAVTCTGCTNEFPKTIQITPHDIVYTSRRALSLP